MSPPSLVALRRGFCVPPQRRTTASCGGPQRKDGLYIKQYNWHTSGQSIVFPFVDNDDDRRPADAAKTSPMFPDQNGPKSANQNATPTDTPKYTAPSTGHAANCPVGAAASTAAHPSSIPGVRCGSLRPGRMVKQGRLGTNAVYHYKAKKHTNPTQFLHIEGRHFGWEPLPPPPHDPAPDEEPVPAAVPETPPPTKTPPTTGKTPSERAGNADAESATESEAVSRMQAEAEAEAESIKEEDEESERALRKSNEVELHKSTMSLNLRIPEKDLGADFKRKKILRRLQLLDAERSGKGSTENDNVALRQHKIRFSDEDVEAKLMQIDSDDDVDEVDGEIRSCSTCDGSIDYLVCSKPANQRKSIGMWRDRHEDDLAAAYDKVINQLGTPNSKRSRASQRSSWSSSDSSIASNESLHAWRTKENALHPSHQQLNLSILNMDQKEKRLKVLERLKVINEELKRDPSVSREGIQIHLSHSEDIDPTQFPVIIKDGELSLEDLTANEEIRSCDSCKNSLDMLNCSHPGNARKSFLAWREKDASVVQNAVDKVSNTLRI